jgi:two-component system response regulator YesN
MYKVLLADDEQIVIDSLVFILERNFPGELEIFTARSGIDAIGVCHANRIDIAFMDINMPGLNGIEAIKTIKDTSPSIIVIVLTAFDRFDYARQAINLGVQEYLSKPVNRNKIAETMRNAMASVDELRRKQLSDIRIREKLDSVGNIVENDFIYSLIFPSDKAVDAASYLDFFGITEPAFYFLTIEIPGIEESDRSSTYVSLRDIVSSTSKCIIGPLMRNRVVVFVPRDPLPDPDADTAEILADVKLLHSRITTRLGIRARVGLGRVERDLSRSLTAYNDSLSALMQTDESSGVFSRADIAGVSAERYPVETEQRLYDRVAAGDIQSVHSLFSAILAWLSERYSDDLPIVRGSVFGILSVVRHLTRLSVPGFGGFAVWKESYRHLESLEDAESIGSYALSSIDECIAVIAEQKRNRMSPVIAKASAIIRERISQEISLDDIARQVEISPFYFSKLFKEEAGENFIDYVNSMRIQNAKDLLRDPSLSIKEISAAVGISDPNYFGKLFKKLAGVTPSEFREKI